MIEYNFYIKEQGQDESEAIKQNPEPLAEPRFVFNPDDIGDGDWVALVEVLVDGVSIGIKYRTEFTLDQLLTALHNESGGSAFQLFEGDVMLVGFHQEFVGSGFASAYAVQGLELTVDEPDVHLTWDHVVVRDGYNVYVSVGGDADFEKINSSLITDNEYSLTNLEDGSYFIYIASVLNGVESSAYEIDNASIGVFYTDFSEYALNEQPAGWDAYGGGVYQVKSHAGAEGGKALSFTGANSGQNILLWTEIGDLENCIIETRFYSGQGGNNLRVGNIIRAFENSTGYLSYLVGNSPHWLSLFKLGTGQLDSVSNLIPHQVWARIETRIEGGRIRIRAWQESEPKPETWLIDETDASPISTGKVGFFSRNQFTATDTWYDWIRITPL